MSVIPPGSFQGRTIVEGTCFPCRCWHAHGAFTHTDRVVVRLCFRPGSPNLRRGHAGKRGSGAR